MKEIGKAQLAKVTGPSLLPQRPVQNFRGVASFDGQTGNVSERRFSARFVSLRGLKPLSSRLVPLLPPV